MGKEWPRLAVQGYLAHKKYPPVGPHSRSMHRALRWSKVEGSFEGEWRFLMGEAPL